jgi:hypothetical protein
MQDRRNFLKLLLLSFITFGFSNKSLNPQSNFTMGKQVSNQIKADLLAWDSIELHRTGTKGDQETGEWLAAEIQKINLKAELDEITFIKRTPGRAEVSDGKNSIGGLPMFDGGSTEGKIISEKAGFLNSDSPIGITDYNANDRGEATKTLEEARKRNAHQIIVAVADVAPSVPGLAVLNAEAYNNPYGPPVLQVATQERAWLMEVAKNNSMLTVSADLKDTKSTATNVQTIVNGRNKSLNPIVVMTPKSGWWTCTSERGGGITVWLNALRHLANNQPERDVIFTANTGHELSHIGLDHYLEKNAYLIKEAHAWVHLGANFAAKDGMLLWQTSNKNYMTAGLKALEDLSINEVAAMPVGQRALGEARNIFDGGGEYISLLGSNPFFHHPNDRWPHSVDIAKLMKLNDMMLKMIGRLANEE